MCVLFLCSYFIASIYEQYLKDSIGQIIKFFESNAGVSQKLALETAAAVQV